MEKEFNLSDYVCEDEFKIEECYWIFADKVKEFIQKTQAELKEEILNPNTISKGYIEVSEFKFWLDKIFKKNFGDKLI